MKKNRLFLFILLSVVLFACTEKKSTTNQPGSTQQTQDKASNTPARITYLRLKVDFSRRVDKGFTIVTLDLKTGNEKEYSNEKYRDVSIMDSPNPHPYEKKVVTNIRKYNGAPHTIIEIELDSGEVRELPNISPQSLLPRYSPDGTKIVYHDAMNADNHARVVIYDIDDEKGEHLPCDGLRCWQPDWHPSGKKIIFVEDKKKIIEYDLTSRTQTTRYALKELQSDIEVLDPKYSPDGTKILFLEYKKKKTSFSNYRKQNTRKLILLDVNNTAAVVYKKKGMSRVEWCPDSKHIIYTAFNYSDQKLSGMHLLKLGEKKPIIIKSFDQEHIKAAAYCR